MSLGNGVDPKLQICQAGLSYLGEANAVASQMKKLKYRSVVIVQTKDTASKAKKCLMPLYSPQAQDQRCC